MKNRQLADLLETLADAIETFGPKTSETYDDARPLLRHNKDFDSGETGGGILWKKWNKAREEGKIQKANKWRALIAICRSSNPKLERPVPQLPIGPAGVLRDIAEGLHQGRKLDDEAKQLRAIVKKHLNKSADEIQDILKTTQSFYLRPRI